jgi:thymidylate synthase
MIQYRKLVKDVMENGYDSDDRTGVGTKSVFGRQVRFDLQKGFPLLNLKRTYWKGVLVELLWLMRGETNIKFLTDRGVHIWDEWADENGDLGPVYGEQWRNWSASELEQKYPGASLNGMEYVKIDQLYNAIQTIKNNPNSRRIIVSAWNAGMIDQMKLPPCHSLFQFYVRGGKLSCQLYQRSADLFLGVPFNIASYACLTHLIANDAGLEVGEFVHTFGDLHLYKNHLPQCEEMLQRHTMKLPKLQVNLKKDDLMYFIDKKCDKMSWEELQEVIQLEGYKSHPTIKGEVAV